jgi:signal transduction histidine kinase
MTVELVRPERLLPGHRHPLPEARRATDAEIERQVALVGSSPVVAALLDAVDAVLLVLNPQRQVVAWNGPRRADAPLGKRPGEVLACVNANSRGGCGTARACETCGALGAILCCERSARPVGAECVIAGDGGAAVELDVRAAPVQLEGERYTVVTLRDVSTEKRREALEQIFFHDLMNTASGLRGWAWRLGRPGADVDRARERIDLLSRQLEREIRDHRAFALAEEGTLVPSPSPVRPRELLEEVAALLSEHPCAAGRTLSAAAPAALSAETDRALLGRVLVNMARNALEATPPGGTVRLRCDEEPESGALRFSVHNPGAMPEAVQGRVFQRSFSTKGRGRGLGTYGMKLIGERYLSGEVWFTSTAEAGTTFSIRVPAHLPDPSPSARG